DVKPQTTPQSRAGRAEMYTVVRGDTLSGIVDRGVCALAAVAAGAYLAAGRLDALLWHSAAVTCVLMPVLLLALRRTRTRTGLRDKGDAVGAPAAPVEEPVPLPVDEGAAPRP
ncbi:peptidase, partial [Streptomyces sp. NPDC001494]